MSKKRQITNPVPLVMHDDAKGPIDQIYKDGEKRETWRHVVVTMEGIGATGGSCTHTYSNAYLPATSYGYVQFNGCHSCISNHLHLHLHLHLHHHHDSSLAWQRLDFSQSSPGRSMHPPTPRSVKRGCVQEENLLSLVLSLSYLNNPQGLFQSPDLTVGVSCGPQLPSVFRRYALHTFMHLHLHLHLHLYFHLRHHYLLRLLVTHSSHE
jgi:hypothetical protein